MAVKSGTATKTSTVVTEIKVETKVPTVDLTASAKKTEDALMRFVTAKEAIKAFEAQKKLAEADLRDLLGDAETAIIRGIPRFKLSWSSNSRIDSEKLKEAWPEAYAATHVSTPYNFIKTI